MGIRIISTGYYVPDKILTNKDLEKMVDTSDEWITQRTGIKERRIASKEQASSDLAYEASKKALEKAGLSPKDIDFIIVATVTPDYSFPSTGCVLQAKLNAREIMALDISAGCSGFLYALALGRGLLYSVPQFNYGLIVGVETLSKIIDWEDRSTCVLFGDGAGAVVIGRHNPDKIKSVYLGGDGRIGDLLILPAGGSKNPASIETVKNRMHYVKMEGREVFKNAVRMMQYSAIKVLELAGLKPDDISWLVLHQANIRIIEATRERLGISKEKVYINIDKYGNTSAASIPIALAEMDEKGLLKEGDIVVMVAFGAGFTWGGIVLEW